MVGHNLRVKDMAKISLVVDNHHYLTCPKRARIVRMTHTCKGFTSAHSTGSNEGQVGGGGGAQMHNCVVGL